MELSEEQRQQQLPVFRSYNRPFDLDAIAEGIGYPLFMKPYRRRAVDRRVAYQGPLASCTAPTTNQGSG